MRPYNFSMLSRKKLAISAAALVFVLSSAYAQTLSGYTGSTSTTDGYKGEIRKVTTTKKQYDAHGIKPVTEARTEYIYNSKGQRIATKTPETSITYTYGSGFFIVTAEGRVTAKATFNDDGTLKAYESYKKTGKRLRRDTYTYKDGKIAAMERTDENGKILSKWTYKTDADGNTLITSEDGNSSYTYSADGILLREYQSADGLSGTEKLYDASGFETSLKMFSLPSPDNMMPPDIPTTDISYTKDCKTDGEGRITEVVSGVFIKLNDKWYDADGLYVSSEERRNGKICLTWISYRYDGLLAEIQTEYWSAPTDENRTGYTSLAEEYFYNGDDELTQIITYDETGNEAERVTYIYGDDGLLAATETDAEPKTTVSYVWNSDRKVSSKLARSIQDDMFITSIEEYAYDKRGNVTELFVTSIQKSASGSGTESSNTANTVQFATRTESRYFYDSDGVLAKKETLCKDKKETEYYDYDESGRLILAAVYTEFGDGAMTYSEKAYKYEEDLDCTKVSEYDSLHTKKVYSYNKAGNVSGIKEYETRFKDGAYSDIITSVTEYVYN